MRKTLLVLLALLPAGVLTAQTTTITASHIQSNVSGQLLASGYVCLTPVNSQGVPTAITPAGGGGQVQPTQACFTITAGAISDVSVPDTGMSTPPGIGYQLQVQNAAHWPIYSYPSPIFPTGVTWNLDAYAPLQTLAATDLGINYSPAAPAGTCSGQKIVYTSNLSIYSCIGGSWVQIVAGSITGSAVSFPSATAAGQPLVSSGAGTTYIAGTALGTAAYQATSAFDVAGAASSAQTAAEAASDPAGSATAAQTTAITQAEAFAADADNITSGTVAAARIPVLNQSTTGNAATASALASTPTLCGAGQAPTGILANGNATGCAAIGSGGTTLPTATAANQPLLSTGAGSTYAAGTALGTAAYDAASAFDAAGAAVSAQTTAEAYAANASNLSSGTVSASRLPASGATAGAYTNANITVDATGRVTAATNGAASGSGESSITGVRYGNGSSADTAATSAQLTAIIGSGVYDASGAASSAQASSLQASNNLSDVASAATARTNLGLGTASTQASTAFDASGAASSAQAAAEAYAANASNISSGTIAAARVPTLNQSTTGNAATATTATTATTAATATNVAGGTVGSLHYQSATGTTAMLAPNTAATDQVLVSHGTGSAGAAPTLSNAPALSAANFSSFPTLNQSTTGNAGTATALATTPTLCTSGQAPTGVLANGNATGCQTLPTSGANTYTGSQTAPGYATNGSANGYVNLGYTGTAAPAPGASSWQITAATNITTPWSLSPAPAPPAATNLMTVTTSGQQGWLTPPAGAIVGTTDTQTLTNKSIAGTEINSGAVPTAQLTNAPAAIAALTGCSTTGNVYTPAGSDCVAQSGGAATLYSIATGPATNTTLSSAATSSATTLSLTSATGYPTSNAYLYLGASEGNGEWVYCTTLTTNTYSGCTRGLFGNSAVAQTSGTSVQEVDAFSTSSLSGAPHYISMFNGALLFNPGSTFNANYSYNMGTGSPVYFGDTNGPYAVGLNLINGSAIDSDNNGGVSIQGATNTTNLNVNGTLTTGGNSVGLTAATTIASTTFASTGLVLPTFGGDGTPITSQGTVHGRCSIIWEQSTAVSTVQFGIGDAATPTSLYVMNTLHSGSNGSTSADVYTARTGTASTTAISATAISGTGAPGAISTAYSDQFDFQIVPGGIAQTLTVYALSGSASDAVVIEPGSFCEIFP